MFYGILYSRWSSAEQGDGDSAERQNRSHDGFCEAQKIAVNERYADDGKSAFHGTNLNAGLGKILAAIRSGKYQKGKTVLVIEDYDRFSRALPAKSMALLDEIMRHGIGVGIVGMGRIFWEKDLGTADYVALSMFAYMAHQKSKTLSDRLKSVHVAKRKEQRAGKATTSICPFWLDRVGERFIPNANEPVLKQAIETALELKTGVGSILKKLGLSPVKAKNGKRNRHNWTGLSSVFRSRTLLGEFQPMIRTGKNERVADGEPIQGYYPAIITEAKFQQLQAAINSRLNHSGNGGGRNGDRCANLFKGLMVDSEGVSLVSTYNSRKQQILIRATRRGGYLHYGIVEYVLLRFFLKLSSKDLCPVNLGKQAAELEEVDAKIKRMVERKQAAETSSLSPDCEDAEYTLGLAGKMNAVIKNLQSKRDELRVSLATDHANAVEDCQGIVEALDSLTGKELIAARESLRGKIAGMVERIVVRWTSSRCFFLTVKLSNGRFARVDTDNPFCWENRFEASA